MGKVEHHVWYKQYQQLKAENPDTILLYRMGDFYELFDDDAKLVAELLELTLARKDYATEKTTKGTQKFYCAMAGMPYHAVEGYVARLVSQGYRVAIAEQLSETPSSKSDTRPRSVFATGLEQTGRQRGIVHREIVRVITPGTVVDPAMLPTGRDNYLVAIISQHGTIGLSYADLSTGEFAATEFSGERASANLEGELVRLSYSEILVPDDEQLRPAGFAPSDARLSQDLAPMTKQERDMLLPHERVARRLDSECTTSWIRGHITPTPQWCWDSNTAQDILKQQLGVHSLAGFGLDTKPLATRAAGAILHYIQDTQRGRAAQITMLRVYTTGAFMFLDPQTRRNLELLEGSSGKTKSTLVHVLDYTQTPMGARLLRRWLSQPLLDSDALRRRQDAVACCVEHSMARAELRQALDTVGDMERVVNRLMHGTSVATPRDLVYLRQALRALPNIITTIADYPPLLSIHAEDDYSGSEWISGNPDLASKMVRETNTNTSGTDTSKQTVWGNQPIPPKPQRGPAPRVAGDVLFDDEDDEGEDENAGNQSTEDQAACDSGADTGNAAHATLEQPAETHMPAPNDNGTGSPVATTSHHSSHTTGASAAPSRTASLDPCREPLDLLERALDDDPPALLGASNYLRDDDGTDKPRRVFRPGYDQRIDQVVAASRDAQTYINTLEARERTRTGIKSLKVEYNKVFGYFIEVGRTYSNQVPSDYERKQTLVNAERYITAELKEYESVVLNAQQRLVEYERDAFIALCGELVRYGERLRATAQTLARLDVLASLAEAAVRGRYTRPSINDGTTLTIRKGRHPVVEKVLDEAFIPNDTRVTTDEMPQILLITGPNMAGKSTVLRQVALIVLMAQTGSFVPAEYAEVGMVDRIFTRIGAQDDIATGQSTFMVEMTETAALLMQSSHRSLIILDEVGRGTSTYDGMAIARAVVEYIHNEPRLGCRTLFATHYHELTDLETILPRVDNYHMAAVEQDGRVVFLYELRRGCADRSYGIHVAELAGIPRVVIRRASELLAELEQYGHHTPEYASAHPQHTSQREEHGQETTNNRSTSRHAEGVQLSLFDVAPNPVVEYIKRLNINELTPIEALTKLYELQRIAQKPLSGDDVE